MLSQIKTKIKKEHYRSVPLRMLAPGSLGGIFVAPDYRARQTSLIDIKRQVASSERWVNLRGFPREMCLSPQHLGKSIISFPVSSQRWDALGFITHLVSASLKKIKMIGKNAADLRRQLAGLRSYGRPRLSTATIVALLFVNIFLLFIYPISSRTVVTEDEHLTLELYEGEPYVSDRVQEFELWLTELDGSIAQSRTNLTLIRRRATLADGFHSFDLYPIDPDNAHQAVSQLPGTLAIYEKYRPPEGWLDRIEPRELSEIYSDTAEPWRDEYGNVMRIEDGFVIMKIPKRMAPMYEYLEDAFGIPRYVLMAVATIESKQGTSMVSTTNCQGWGHYCPGTIRLFARKQLLPEDYSPYDDYDGLAGAAVHLWVSSQGLTNYRRLTEALMNDPEADWPLFWAGETPEFEKFEEHSWDYPIIPATWGYNRDAFYGYSVAHLAKFYMEHDQL